MVELKNTNQHAYDWLKEKNSTHWSRSHLSIRSQSDMLVNNLSEYFNKVILEARGNSILTITETIKTKIILLIVKKKEEAEKIKEILPPKIKKKLDVNMKNSLSDCFLGVFRRMLVGDRYQVECGPSNQHVVDLVENSCSCRNWDLTGIPCMHVVVVIHKKDEYPETYLAIYSNFIRPVRGPKQWESVPDMLLILPPTLRKPPSKPIKVKRHKVGVHNQGCPNSARSCPNSAISYSNSAKSCPNSSTIYPNLPTSCWPKRKAFTQEETNHC
ncbi:hypothetical protein GOBAR_DD34735 [Gossypium barbadense]|nr:hypothetical protein GOBAR_DD34735 [Gossypium barbadense]